MFGQKVMSQFWQKGSKWWGHRREGNLHCATDRPLRVRVRVRVHHVQPTSGPMAPKKPQLSARKGQLSHRDFKDTAKDSMAKGSESARSVTLSTESAKPKKMKGLALAISQIPVLDDSEVDESLTTEELIQAQERADALEHQIEMQKSQFEQQMQQSALAMEELFDQLTAMRKERDVAVTALQRALEERHADYDAELYSIGGAITTPEGAMQEVRLHALKASYEKLQLDHAHSRLECRRLSAENRQLQAVVAAIKQLILAEPVAVSARRSPNAEMEDDMEETEETFIEDASLHSGAPTQQPTPATATAMAAAAAPSTTEPKVGIPPLDLNRAAVTVQSHVRGRAAREQGRLLRITYGDRKDSIRSPLSELRAPRYSSEMSQAISQAGTVRDGDDDAEPLASLRVSRGSIDPVAEAAEEDYWAEEDDDG